MYTSHVYCIYAYYTNKINMWVIYSLWHVIMYILLIQPVDDCYGCGNFDGQARQIWLGSPNRSMQRYDYTMQYNHCISTCYSRSPNVYYGRSTPNLYCVSICYLVNQCPCVNAHMLLCVSPFSYEWLVWLIQRILSAALIDIVFKLFLIAVESSIATWWHY